MKSLMITKAGNKNPYTEEEQATQWSKENIQRTNHDLQKKSLKIPKG